MSFIIAQELTTHLRLKQCKYEENTENSFKCEQCPFSSNSSSELLFHKALHSEQVIFQEDNKDSKVKPIARYKCPICDKIFPKVSLLGHIRQHTQERPFTCNICGNSFARKNNLQYHIKNHGNNGSRRVFKKAVSNDKPFLCSTCGSSFAKRLVRFFFYLWCTNGDDVFSLINLWFSRLPETVMLHQLNRYPL